MRIAYTAEQERLRRELRGYFGELMTPSVRAALAGGDGDYGSISDGLPPRRAQPGDQNLTGTGAPPRVARSSVERRCSNSACITCNSR